MRSLPRPLVCIVPLLGVLACASAPSGPSLDDRVFLSQSVTEGGAPRALVTGTQLQLSFYPDHRVSASAGCNSLGGDYAIDGGLLRLHDASHTAMGCDAERHAQDDWYFGFLGSSPSITIEADRVVLDGKGTRIEYLDQEVATPDVGLTGRTWTVDTIIEGDLASHASWPDPATLVFKTDGTVAISTGCNAGSGKVEISGAAMTFSDVSVTERGCASPTAELEHAVLGVVLGPQPVTWEISVDRLSLRGTNAGLDLVASEG